MYNKRGVIGFAIILCICVVIGSSALTLAQSAEQTYDVDVFLSVKMSPVFRSKEITIVGAEAMGMMRSNHESKVFDNCTVHSLVTIATEGKDKTVNGYIKYIDSDGDCVIFRSQRNPGEKTATMTILTGTGKWKGITGGGKIVPVAWGKPVVEGAYLGCNNHKGTFKLPK